jgi:hypothetical protein
MAKNRIESDHAAMKRLLSYRQRFRSLRTAKATLSGIEIVRTIKPGHIHHSQPVRMNGTVPCRYLRMLDQLALGGLPSLYALTGRHSEISCVLLGKCLFRPRVAFDLSEDRRSVLFKNAWHL